MFPTTLDRSRSDDTIANLRVEEARPHRTRTSAARRLLYAMTVTLAVIAGSLAFASPAEAVSGSCGGGRCIVRLSQTETRLLGYGRVPPTPAWVPWQLKVAYSVTAAAHIWFAGQYASRNWCSAVLLSVYPWENQGYTGYRC